MYRREKAVMKLVATLFATDYLSWPLLPNFFCPVSASYLYSIHSELISIALS